MKLYKGYRGDAGCVVTVDDAPLDPRLDIRHHSDAGFEWGYEGSGPRQLALAILADHMNDDQQALTFCQVFTENVVSQLKDGDWILTSEGIQTALDQVAIVPMDLKTLLDKVRGRPT
jgi:hypothetical protein